MSRNGGRFRRGRGHDGYEEEAFVAPGWSAPAALVRPAMTAPSGGPEAEATVKWYKPEKGFGFVELMNGGGDSFLHANVLERFGMKQVDQGDLLRVRTSQGPKGSQVSEVVEFKAGSPRPANGPRMERRPSPGPQSFAPLGEAQSATVKWFNSEKGFGFVCLSNGGPDVFLHAKALERSGMLSVREGQVVMVRIAQGRKGPEVGSITPT